jgi:hypothetical protein
MILQPTLTILGILLGTVAIIVVCEILKVFER